MMEYPFRTTVIITAVSLVGAIIERGWVRYLRLHLVTPIIITFTLHTTRPDDPNIPDQTLDATLAGEGPRQKSQS